MVAITHCVGREKIKERPDGIVPGWAVVVRWAGPWLHGPCLMEWFGVSGSTTAPRSIKRPRRPSRIAADL